MLAHLGVGPSALRLSVLCVLMEVSVGQAQFHSDGYELQRVRQYLDASGLTIDPSPEGKIVRRVLIVRREVFEGDDLLVPVVLPRFAPTWPNQFHQLTEAETIRREVLLVPGQPYRGQLAEESVRNLKSLPILSLARVDAVATDLPDQVDVLVYTRDLWSLRLTTEFSGAGDTFGLSSQLIERNFLGRGKTLGARFALAPDVYSFGETYVDPRMFGQELQLSEIVDVLWNRQTGSPEGSVGQLSFGHPYYTLAQRFSFDFFASYSDFVARDLREGELIGYAADTGKICDPGPRDCLRRVWDEWRMRIQLGFSHRTGVAYKQTFTGGIGYSDRRGKPNAETQLGADQETLFRAEVLPRARRDVYPYFNYRLSLPRFVSFTDLGTYGLSEIVQLGPRLDGTLFLPLAMLGSTRNGMLARGMIGYTWGTRDWLVDALIEAASRLYGDEVVDRKGLLQLRAASPSFDWLFGRLIARALWELRQNDTQNTPVTLGADNGLRGYPAQALFGIGASRVLWNVEYRTRPVVIQSIHVGLAAFYDVGSVYQKLQNARFHQGVGAGVRVLLPQLNRDVFRLDVGAPLGKAGFSVLLSYGSDQVVPLTPAEDSLILPGFPGRPDSGTGTSLR